MTSPLVTVEWLSFQDQKNIIVLDASLRPSPQFIPGARIFDIDEISDLANPLPHMMPEADFFEARARDLGVHGDSHVVVYDNQGIYSAPRAWWMFKSMGHDKVSVLEGGLPAWINAGKTVSATPAHAVQGSFTAQPRNLFCDLLSVTKALGNPEYCVIDARSKGRFDGTEKEPREGLRSGHMPGSVNLPFKEVLNGLSYKPTSEIRGLFAALAGSDKKLIFSCGSGVTACILALASELIGRKDLKVYDGSWSEWGSR